ncbi:MAG: DUF2993 domain-containing protein [Actinomycetota bacterium]|nr:DUF2993 domain-containing protein [Actinomycetota bacterium]
MVTHPPSGPLRHRRRRRRLLPVTLVSILTLVAVAIAVDRIAVAVADHELATHIQSSQHLSHTPSVSIRGFPFLTQLAARKVNEVDVTVRDFAAGAQGRTLQIARLSVALHEVHLAKSFSAVRIDSASATADITYAALTSTLGVRIGYGGATSDGTGRIAATASTAVLGQTVSGAVSAQVHVSPDNVLSFVNPQVSVDGSPISAPAIVDALAAVFKLPVSLLRLPFGLTVSSVRASPVALVVILTGTGLSYG